MARNRLLSTVIILSSLLLIIEIQGHGPCALLDAGSSSICISIEEINSAFRQARLAFDLLEPFDFSPHKVQYHHHQIDQLGLVLVETSRILAKKFQLDYEQIFDFLPKLDLELTDIWKFCPAIFKKKTCKITKYRTLSGHCNNFNHPDWGAAVTPFGHIIPPYRIDSLSEPREYGSDSAPLPSPRHVSTKMHRDKLAHDHAVTIMLIAWGQFIDHDITFTAETKEIPSGKEVDCCSENIYENTPKERHHNCYPIKVPYDDSFYSHYYQQCMSFTRSFAGVRTGCRLGTRTAFNSVSSFLDANVVYGSNTELGKDLRSGKDGTLKTLPLFEDLHLKDLLPLKMDHPDDGCIRPNPDIYCFLAGDNRVNEQLVLTTLHTILMREHNRIATGLSEVNPHWDDEKLYQETRRIIIAIQQHITYNEFLPMVLGRDLLNAYGLNMEDGYWTGYDPNQYPGALEEFITSAFRFGHSLLPHKIERWSTTHHFIDSTPLHELLRQPFDLFRPGYTDSFIMGLVNQLAQVMDEAITEQVTTLLFKEKGKRFGMDLAAMNIQRGRDHGVPPFAAYRKICGLSEISTWDDLIGVMKNESIYNYKTLYRSAWDIDLWSGGISEIPLPGSLLGPTFGCIIAKQFQALRYGDRFWFELPDLPSSFTLEQINEIKSIKLSRILCDNGDAIKTIQVYAMVHHDHNINPRVSCHSKVLPQIDLERWRDTSHETGFFEDVPRDVEGHESISIHKAHLYTDLETLKPPLFDSAFLSKEPVQEEDTSEEKQAFENATFTSSLSPPHSHNNYYIDPHYDNTTDLELEKPFSYEDYVPPFRKIPEEDLDEHIKDITNSDDPETEITPNFDYEDGMPEPFSNPFPPQEYDFPPFDFDPPPIHFHEPPPRKPTLLSFLHNRKNFLMNLFHRRKRHNTPYYFGKPRPMYRPFFFPKLRLHKIFSRHKFHIRN